MDDNFDAFRDAFDHANEQFTNPATNAAKWPFQCLGYDRDRFYLYTEEGRQVLTYSARQLHSAADLVALAQLRFFEDEWPGKQESFLVRAAGDAIIRACRKAGVYDPDRLRGRGVWVDAGRRVMHLGDHLVVDGRPTPLHMHSSHYIYEMGRAMDISPGAPLTDTESRAILSLCRSCSWSDPDREGSLLAGWLVSAVIGGALEWRPHAWLTGEGGSGKTWIFNNIITPLLGDLALYFIGDTSQSGILGDIGRDARPVVFDEAEAFNERDRDRIHKILGLARTASTDGRAKEAKGTADGGSRHASARASFLFSSINCPLDQAADMERFAVLTCGTGTPEQFEAVKTAHAEAIAPDIASRFLARCLAYIPIIRANSEFLAAAFARSGVSRRIGDTVGTLIACQMSLVDNTELTAQTADAYISSRQWLQNAAKQVRAVPEYERALSHLMQAEGMRIILNGRHQATSVGELIQAMIGIVDGVLPSDAEATLKRHGIRIMDDRLVIGNQSSFVAGVFSPTTWAQGWAATLRRFSGATTEDSVRFAPGLRGRAISIPLELVVNAENG